MVFAKRASKAGMELDPCAVEVSVAPIIDTLSGVKNQASREPDTDGNTKPKE